MMLMKKTMMTTTTVDGTANDDGDDDDDDDVDNYDVHNEDGITFVSDKRRLQRFELPSGHVEVQMRSCKVIL